MFQLYTMFALTADARLFLTPLPRHLSPVPVLPDVSWFIDLCTPSPVIKLASTSQRPCLVNKLTGGKLSPVAQRLNQENNMLIIEL